MQNIKFLYTKNHKIKQILNDNIMINQLKTSDLDENLIEVYLKTKTSKKIYGLIKNSQYFNKNDKGINYSGIINNIKYEIIFSIKQNYVYIDVKVEQISEAYELIYTMDIGLGEIEYLQSNEAYASQYLNCEVIKDTNGYNLCMRKSITQAGKNPFLQIGSLQKVTNFSTDGYQFFKTQYKETNNVEHLAKEQLPKEVYQYEFSFIALQTEQLFGDTKQTFYFKYIENSQKLAKEEFELKTVYQNKPDFQFKENKIKRLENQVNKVLQVKDFTTKEINELYPEQTLIEKTKEEKYLSFFTKNHA
ncbi:MAG: hypothetical protein ACK5HR_04210, partial [Mycoplasmatales bacterium]